MYLYREFGGDLFLKDDHGRLATEITEAAPALQIMKQLQGRSCVTQDLEILPIICSQVVNYNPSERDTDARTNCSNFLDFADYPLSLQSLCRLSIRSHIGPQRFCQIGSLSVRKNEENWIGLAPFCVRYVVLNLR